MRKRIIAIVLMVFLLLEILPGGIFNSVTAHAASKTSITRGDYFILGRYLNEEIVWRHVGSDLYGDVALSFRVLTSKAYNSKGVKPANTSVPDGIQVPQESDPRGERASFGANIWINSTLRAWLNSDAGNVSYIGAAPSSGNVTANPYNGEAGFLSNFTAAERAAMATTERAAALNEVDSAMRTAGTQIPGWDNGSSLTDPLRHMVTDTIFLPDAYLLSQIASDAVLNWSVGYWSTGFHRAGITAAAINQATVAGGTPQSPSGEYNAVDYWTGTPQGSQWGGTHQMQIRLVGGGHSFVNVNEGVMGVRPAFYINHNNITITGGSGTQDDPYTIGVFDGSLGLTLKGNNTNKLYAPDIDTLQITAPNVPDLTLSYIMVDPEANINIANESEFDDYSPVPLTPSDGKASLNIDKNTAVWVMAKGTAGSASKTVFASITYKNFYEPVRVYQQGKPKDIDNVYLYHATRIEGTYGVPINKFRSDALLQNADYDEISVLELPQALRGLWRPAADSVTKIILNNVMYYKTPQTITMRYEKDSNEWVTVKFYFVNDSGNPIKVNNVDAQPVIKENWIPQGMTMSQAGESYTFPEADGGLIPYKWGMYDIIDTEFTSCLGDEHQETDGAESIGFDPKMPDDLTSVAIRIYYRANQKKVTERHVVDGTDEILKTNMVSIAAGGKYNRTAEPVIDHYVAVGYQIEGSNRVNLTLGTDGRPVWVNIEHIVDADTNVTYYYAADANGDGIPDREQVQITTRWIGIYNDGGPNEMINPDDTQIVLKDEQITIEAGGPYDNWIFDTSIGAASETINITPSEDTIVPFYYNHDSLGIGVADKEQGVTTKFAVSNGSNLTNPENWQDIFINIVKGGTYIRAVPARAGYVAVGWLLDDETTLRPFTGRNGNQAEFTTNKPNYTVTFVYRTASAPVTIHWVGKARTGKDIEFGYVTVTGYDGEVLTINKPTLRDSVSVDPDSWIVANDTFPADNKIIFSDSPQTFYFYYNEIENFYYDVHYLSSDAKTLFEVKIPAKTTDAQFALTARSFPLYSYTGYEIFEFGTLYASSTDSTDKTITLTPSKGALSVYFYYKSNLTTVTIYAQSGTTNLITPIVVNDILINSEFSYDAPYIQGYKLTDPSQATKTIASVSDTDNTIIFQYKPLPEGKLHVILKEDDTEGRVIAEDKYSMQLGETRTVLVPNLRAMFYTALSTEKTVTYVGADITIEYYYEKDTVQVIKRTYDKADENNSNKQPILELDMGQFRIGTNVRFYAPSKDNYALDDDALKLIRIIPPSNLNARAIYYNEVSFYYAPITSGNLVVEAVNESGGILMSYILTGTNGDSIPVSAPVVSGYRLRSGEPMIKYGTVPDKVKFTYQREAGAAFADLVVTVKAASGAALQGAQVTVKSGGMTVRSCATDSSGKVVLTDLPAGIYDATAKLAGYYDGAATVTLDGDKSINITLSKPGSGNNGNNGDGSSGDGGSGSGGGSSGGGSIQKPPGEEVEPEDIDDGLLEKTVHIKYINGSGDGRVRPDAFVTRAETAAMFHRLLKEAPEPEGGFTDVDSGAWYADYVGALAALGIVRGYPSGAFGPADTVTRAEFAAIISRFEELEDYAANSFNDVDAGHWAIAYINSAYVKGWISGYPSGGFGPDNPITRAEAVTVINRILNRKIRKEDIPDGVNIFNDLSKEHWAYADILEAAIEHDYERDDEGYEIWHIK